MSGYIDYVLELKVLAHNPVGCYSRDACTAFWNHYSQDRLKYYYLKLLYEYN